MNNHRRSRQCRDIHGPLHGDDSAIVRLAVVKAFLQGEGQTYHVDVPCEFRHPDLHHVQVSLCRNVEARHPKIEQPDRNPPVVANRDDSVAAAVREIDEHHAWKRIYLPPSMDINRGVHACETKGSGTRLGLHSGPEAGDMNVLEQRGLGGRRLSTSRSHNRRANAPGRVVVLPAREQTAAFRQRIAFN